MTSLNEVKALCELERIYLAPLCCTDPNEGRLWCEHDVWPLDDCNENACGVPYVRADIVAAKDALIESLSARNAEMVEKLTAFRRMCECCNQPLYVEIHDVWPLDDCDENACGVPYVRADIVAAKDALIESLSARNAEMVEALAHARQVLAVYQPEGAPTFYMEALWKAEAALDTPSKQLGEAK